MKLRPDCLPCVLHQALQFARAQSEDDFSVRKLLGVVLRSLQETDWGHSPADLLQLVLRDASEALKGGDPFAALRAKGALVFAQLAAEARPSLEQAEDPLALALLHATAANLADELVFPRFRNLDVSKELAASVEAGFAKGSPAEFRVALEGVERVLYLLDNAGEAHFDALLVEQLIKAGKAVTVVTRAEGLLHDATASDAAAARLTPPPPKPAEPPSAEPPSAEPPSAEPPPAEPPPAAPAPAAPALAESPSVESTEPSPTDASSTNASPSEPSSDDTVAAAAGGSKPEDAPAPAAPESSDAALPSESRSEAEVGEESEGGPTRLPIANLLSLRPGELGWPTPSRKSDLGQALEEADLVIAKGSAYYETMDELEDHAVIHLLRAKCPPVAEALGVQPGDLVLLHRPPSLGTESEVSGE